MKTEWEEEDRRSSQASSGSSGEKRREENESPSEEMGACCSGEVHERSGEDVHSQIPLATGKNFLGIRGDCTELAVTQKVTKLTETKPGNKDPPNITQGWKSEAV